MRVSRYDYAAQFDGTIDAVVDDIRAILLRGDYVPSPEMRRFEGAFAGLVGARYARMTGCGTDALTLALRALGVGPGDEVVTQANTFYATVAAIAFTGATPVLVDADDETFLMNLEQLGDALTARTKAVIPVHLYGKPTRMSVLVELARRNGLAVIEDAAQAHGAMIDGRFVGTFGDAGCFSFHPSKNLAAAGDGGCVVTDSEELATLVDAHRTHGQLVQHEHIVLGTNSKLDAIQAVVLQSKLGRLLEWNASRRATAARYRQGLVDTGLSFQREHPGELHAYHLLAVRTSRRDALLAHLQSKGVDAVVRYPVPIHLQPPFARHGWRRGQFPVAEALANELLCLPIRPRMPATETDYVIEQTRAFCLGAAA